MADKRVYVNMITDFQPYNRNTKIKAQPQKPRAKRDITSSRASHTPAEIQKFKDGVANIKDWTSLKLDHKHVQVVYWFDVEGLSKAECAKRYPNKEGLPCSAANIFKTYNKYAPRFYAEKGLTFIPLGKRITPRARALVPRYSVPRRQGAVDKRLPISKRADAVPYTTSRLDRELRKLFERLPEPAVSTTTVSFEKHVSSHVVTDEDWTICKAKDMLKFVCKASDISHGSESCIHIKRSCAVKHCEVICKALQNRPYIHTIQYGPEFSADTVSRFTACCSPLLPSGLPSHVNTSFGTFEQEWSMSDLEELYTFALCVGAFDICDMVIDRWHEKIQRPEPRVVTDDFGNTHIFSILQFGPELPNFPQKDDAHGFRFFLSVLASQGQAGWDLLCDTHLGNWHEEVKKELALEMSSGAMLNLVDASPEFVCEMFHHHGPQGVARCYRKQAFRPCPEMEIVAAHAHESAQGTLHSDLKRIDPSNRSFGVEEASDTDNENILQISIPDFDWVHNRYPRYNEDDSETLYFNQFIPDRLRQNRNTYLDDRMRYKNPCFNAHHDTEAICEEKIRMVKAKLALFREEGIVLDQGVLDRALGGLGERDYGAEDGEEEDDDDDEMDVDG
jgi:hypothetical protein